MGFDGTPPVIMPEVLTRDIGRFAVALLVVRHCGATAVDEPEELWRRRLYDRHPKLGAAADRWFPAPAGPEASGEVGTVLAEVRSPTAEARAVKPVPAVAASLPPRPVSLSSLRADETRRQYCRAALADEARTVAAILPGGQRDALFLAAVKMGSLIAAGYLDEATVVGALTAAAKNWKRDAEKGPWHPPQIAREIANGIAMGRQTPRDMSEIGVPASGPAPAETGGGSNFDAAVERLAALPRHEYDRTRSQEAAALGVRVGTLDAAVRHVQAVDDDDDNDQSPRDQVIEIGMEAELWHNSDHVGYATVNVGDHRENWRLRSDGFRRWVLREFGRRFPLITKKGAMPTAPSDQAYREGLNALEAAAGDGPIHEPCVRVGGNGNRIYLDLGTPDWTGSKLPLTAGGSRAMRACALFGRPVCAPPDPATRRRGRLAARVGQRG